MTKRETAQQIVDFIFKCSENSRDIAENYVMNRLDIYANYEILNRIQAVADENRQKEGGGK